jgi:hypothetical protein
MVSVPFRLCIQHHLVAKLDILLSLWMRQLVLFHMVCRVTMYDSWIVVEYHFFLFFLFFLSCQIKCTIDLFDFFFNLSSYSFDFLIRYYSFYKIVICFQFNPSITISHMVFFFSILVFILLSFNFFHWLFNLLKFFWL